MRLAGDVTVTLMTFDKQSNRSPIEVDRAAASCNHRLTRKGPTRADLLQWP